MTKVFIGGSRAVSRLNDAIREKLDDLIDRECEILMGDANGTDRAVQMHFADRGYRRVAVYCMGKPRNNLGAWEARPIEYRGAGRGFAYYAAKDLAMARDAKCGIMLWDGKSKGTLNNVQNLLNGGKKTLVYFSPERRFYKLVSQEDLDDLMRKCDRSVIADARREIESKLATSAQLSLHATQT